ncbi:Cif family virulence factor [Echinicola rosea]|uniref:Polyketide cyclase n=1 Tax=Echinicola rosea TaxID=1807691 RepID=A0ABQ1V4M6_9BACT|nr:nuclear transport factor 2 family protein [Echinicola rosea]GGF38218.1 polyketide cyclase [Echinicola rosea]
MNLPNIISALIAAQKNFDSYAYANCFSEDAVVFDEEKTFKGRGEIEKWIAAANKKYHTVVVPLKYEEMTDKVLLTTENSGTFPGSPLILKYHFTIKENLIQSLRITG